MGIPKNKSKPYSYADYRSWPEEGLWELINGIPYDMSLAPGRKHQIVLLSLARIIADITDKGPCQTFIAPFDVRLAETTGETASEEEIFTVVQPDLSVFCDPTKLDEHWAFGAPDLVVVILSQATSYKDQTIKLELYEKHLVSEYWIVNTDAPWVMVYRMGQDGKFRKPDYYRRGDYILSNVLAEKRFLLMIF